MEDTGVQNGITQAPLFMDCQGTPSPGGIADSAKDMEVSLENSPIPAVNLPKTAPQKLTQEIWKHVEDVLERETQSGPCDVEAVRQDDLDPLMGEDMGLGNAGPNGPILVPTNSGKKTTWKKKARFNCIISSEASKSEFSMEPMLTPGKRALQVETEHSLQD